MIERTENALTTTGRWRKYALIGSVVLFAAACAAPALVLHVGQRLGTAGFRWERYQSIAGGSLLVSGLVFGWLRMNFTGFANLPLWASWLLFARGHFGGARLLALMALGMSMETLQLLVQPYVWDEAMTTEGYLSAPHVGFACWIGSMLLIAFASHRLMPETIAWSA